jgi:hypothetical protein
VFFSTTQPLLPAAGAGRNIYEYNFDGAPGGKVSLVSAGAGAAGAEGVVALSDDGSRAYFVAKGILAGENAEHHVPVEGEANLYVAHATCPGGGVSCASPERAIKFIATLSGADAKEWAANPDEDGQPMSVTPDGMSLVFTSYADLTPDDTSETHQVFWYDAATEALKRVSIGNAGYNINGNVPGKNTRTPKFLTSNSKEGAERSIIGLDHHPAVSDDGRTIVFSSTAALTPQAVEDPETGVENVYEYRAGEVYLISDGRTTRYEENPNIHGSKLLGVSPSGRDIFFQTAAALVSQDTDEQLDVYDARENGGFVASSGRPQCSGAGCQSPGELAVLQASPGSVSFPGENTPATPPATPGGPPALTAKQKLTKALQACRRKHNKRKRTACETHAHHIYAHR